MKKRSITIHGHRTSVTMEDAFWEGLNAIARDKGMSVQKLVEGVDAGRIMADGGLASTLRVYVLNYYRTDK